MKHSVLKYLFAQVLERALRVERILELSRADAARSGARIVSTLGTQAAAIKRSLLALLPRIAKAEAGDMMATWRSLVALCRCFNAFDDLHLKLSYLTTSWTNADIEMFVAAVFDDAARRLGVSADVSVVLSDTYSFEETNLTAALIAQHQELSAETPTLLLPKIEFDNPLQWASLVHEFGHTLFAKQTPGVLTSATDAQSQVRANWTEEVFCDVLAAKLLGPAYVASFTDFVIATAASEPLESFSPSHPDPRFRITALLEALGRDRITAQFSDGDLSDFFYHLFEERAALERKHLGYGLPEIPSLDFDVKSFRNNVVEHIDTIVPKELRATAFDSLHFSRLSSRLGRGIPIGSYNPIEADLARADFDSADEGITAALKDAQSPSTASAEGAAKQIDAGLQAMRRVVKETPCTVAEILNAGWMYKMESVYFPLLKRLPDYDEPAEISFAEQLFRLDSVLRVSIETAYLAKEFIAAFAV